MSWLAQELKYWANFALIGSLYNIETISVNVNATDNRVICTSDLDALVLQVQFRGGIVGVVEIFGNDDCQSLRIDKGKQLQSLQKEF